MKLITRNKILEVYYENPNSTFTVRKISKKTKLPRATVNRYVNKLKKENLITKKNYPANNLLFKTKKINYYIEKIISSNLIEYIIKELNPSCIILFGGIRKGESDSQSDIDLFIESFQKKKINLIKFEKILKHKIDLFIEEDINKLPKNLTNNIINGIKLYGVLKIRWILT